MSYLEIYCEKLRDLLNPTANDLKIRESKSEGFIVQDNREIACADKESVFKVIELGKTNRAMVSYAYIMSYCDENILDLSLNC